MPKLETIRAFVAVNLSVEATNAVGVLQKRLRTELSDLRMKISWIRQPNIHITMKFLGRIDRELGDGVLSAMKKASDEMETFRVRVGNIGAFPSLGRPRVIWVGVKDQEERFVALHEAVERQLETLGFKRDKRVFHPHLTIGRVRRGVEDLEPIIEKITDEVDVESVVDKMTLYESRLHKGGAEYRAIGHAMFNDRAFVHKREGHKEV